MKSVEGVASNKDPSLPTLWCRRRRKVPPSWQEVWNALSFLFRPTRRELLKKHLPLDAGVLTAKSSMFDIADLIILQET
jgi:hypothetical protein